MRKEKVALFLGAALIISPLAWVSWDHPASPLFWGRYRQPTESITNNDADQRSYQIKLDETLWRPSTWLPVTSLTCGLVFIGVLQGLLFFWQLRLIRRSANDAGRAATAAMKSANTAERALADLERAYLFASISAPVTGPRPVAGSLDPDKPLFDITIVLTINNYGKSPAVIRRLRAYLLVDVSPPQSLIELPDSQALVPDGLAIASGVPFTQMIPHRLTHEDWADVVNWMKRIYCCGLVEYADIIGGDRATGFCWHMIYRDTGNGFVISPGTPLNYRT